MAKWVDFFHRHLDVCLQCRDHPFNLCLAGSVLLQSAGQEAMRDLEGLAKNLVEEVNSAEQEMVGARI